ncbi:MAG: hypothetical protein Q9176_003717 [Flavoplaca citrina]
MQTLWARVASSSCSCNCSTCFSSAATVARRTASTPIRRRLGADDVFAAFFSTVAFASAVADGNRKDAKREEWTRVIKDARRDLDSAKAEQQRRIASIASTAPLAPIAPHEETAAEGKQSWIEALDWGEREMQDRRGLGFQDWQGIPLDVLRNASPMEIRHFLKYWSHHFPRFKGSHGSEVWSTVTWPSHIKKIKIHEWSIAHLALDLMSFVPEGQPWSLPNDQGKAEEVMSQLSVATTSELDSERMHIQSLLKKLARQKVGRDRYFYQFESPPLPSYSSEKTDCASSVDQLNAKLHSLFSHTTDPESRPITHILPRICYYLLTSDSPPSIHTYNLLMSEFAGAGRDDLIYHLIASMNRTHMRPNEITLAETLRHFVRTNDRFRFDRYIQRMEGLDDGLGEAHPRLPIPKLLKFQYRVRVNRYFPNQPVIPEYHELSDLTESDLRKLQQETKVLVYEKPRRNLEVHHALIQGALFFHGTSDAIKHYCAMISEGWTPDQGILLSILHSCRVKMEWEAGYAVWRRLQSLDQPIDEQGFLLMLQLCQTCGRHESIEEILHNGVFQGVLPPTVLEMGWQDSERHQDANHMIESFDEVKSIFNIRERVRDLLQKSRADFPCLRSDGDRLQVIAKRIEQSVPQPSPATLALLHKVRICVTTRQYLIKMDAMLRDSDKDIRRLLSSFHDVRFSIDLRKLEARVLCKLSTITQFLEETKNVLLSMRIRKLGNFVAATGLSIEHLKTQVISLKARILSKYLYRLRLQASDIRSNIKNIQEEMSRYVVGYFETLVRTLHARMALESAGIRATSYELEKHVRPADKGVLKIRSLELFGARGEFRVRGEFRIKYPPRIRPLGRKQEVKSKSKENDNRTGPTDVSLAKSGSKHGEASVVEDTGARTFPKSQDPSPMQTQKSRGVRSEQSRSLQYARLPLMPDQRLITKGSEMRVRAGERWRQPPLSMSLISRPPDPVTVYEAEHG